jgi:hypothetical protein
MYMLSEPETEVILLNVAEATTRPSVEILIENSICTIGIAKTTR